MKVITRIYIYDNRVKNITSFIIQLAHFRNMLIILIHKLKEQLGYYPNNEALLYSLLAEKLNLKRTKDKNKIEKLNKLLEIIKSDNFLSELLNSMKKLKNELNNNPALQSIIRQVCKDFKSYRKAYEEYLANSNKFTGKPKPPKAKKLKNIDKFTIELNKMSFKVNNKILHVKLHKNKQIRIKLPEFIKKPSSIRITYYLGFAYVDIVHDKYIGELKPLSNYKAGIDLGVENFATIVSTNDNIPSIVIKSSHLKAFNQWYNKLLAKLRSRIDKVKNLLKENSEDKNLLSELEVLTRRIRKLHLYRKKWMENVAHQVSKAIALYLHKTGHDKVFIGKNILEAKNGSNLSKRVNQNFVQIPFRLFIDKLAYKLKWFGIKLVEVDESFTSKSSCVSDDIIEIQKSKGKVSMSGDRICRGLYFDKVINLIFHADVNGAFNILRVGLKRKRLFKKIDRIAKVKLCRPKTVRLFEFCRVVLGNLCPPNWAVEVGLSR
ncbi:transposase, IS605 OrfB family [Methanocaldococcus sp. FS406-22]|uniref:RNA-guided endonuclease InsQ/TnpB family protein n=1 Tax=Methanocaldococcus sp. (strain FS406-22) TaxID=644281 RepID=UPI0001BF4BFE|nr:RNA-guided endonuclease TnpB family protein [Methanocaldococcus sp. FS406-22]ADC69191.1 transposase, IS605 OrfB family [Methanocaldococcus sp. FS406-22]